MRTAAFLLVGLLFSACSEAPPPAPAPAAPKRYTVQMHRPWKIGDRTHTSTKLFATQTTTVKTEDKVVRSEKDEMRVTLVGVMRVLEVNDDGTPIKTEYTIEKLTAAMEGEEEEVLPPGSVLLATSGVTPPIVMVEGNLSDEVEKILAMVIPTMAPTANDDDVWGTAQPQEIGGSWKVNAERVAEGLRQGGYSIEAKAVNGEGRLAGTMTVEDIECLTVEGEVRASTGAALPHGAKLEEGELVVTFSGLYPVEIKKPVLSDMLELRTRAVAQQKDKSDQQVFTEVVVEQRRERSYRPL